VEKLTNFFNNYNGDDEFSSNQEMSYLLKILPNTLKTKLSKFLFKDAIMLNKFLQNRDDDFYSKFLDELETIRFIKGD